MRALRLGGLAVSTWLAFWGPGCACGNPLQDEEDATSASSGALTTETLMPLFGDALVNGWVDWSWTPHSWTNTLPVRYGSRSAAVRFGAWQGLYFHHEPLTSAPFQELTLWVHGGTEYDGAALNVAAAVNDVVATGVPLARYCEGGKIVAGSWTRCVVPLTALGIANRTFTGIAFKEAAGRTFGSSLFIDAVQLRGVAETGGVPDAGTAVDAGTGGSAVIEPGSPGASDVQLTVRADQDLRPISPLIYGTNWTARADVHRPSVVRMGGNRWTAYNWENNASNGGVDWCFQNDDNLSSSSAPGAAIRDRLGPLLTAGTAGILTVPLVDHVAADKLGGSSPPACSGDVRKSGASYLTTRFRQNRAAKGSALSTAPSTSDAYVNQDEFVAWSQGAFPGAKLLYSLDNEPDLWSSTHAEVHPRPVGYDELCTRNVSFARAIKRVAPAAQVLGFVSYGWSGFMQLEGAADASGKGNFVDYYLARMRAAEVAEGRRLIDHLDLHWYPEAQGAGTRIIGTDTGAAVVEARIQAPRSLWDATYVEQSWIARDVLGNEAIRLLPRIRERIAANYPGTGLAVTEWNYGGGQHISGALATADVLGIFGKEGVQVANLWDLNSDERFTEGALQAYRNFDGAGARFGDTSVRAIPSDRAAASVHASVDAGNSDRVVIVAINKRNTARTAGLTVAHRRRLGNARVYVITSANPRPVAAASIAPVATNAYRYSMPAYSVSVIVPQ